jgi:6-pyruvoyltetrahydropterin/6-carboxytetrahydropterin synthase
MSTESPHPAAGAATRPGEMSPPAAPNATYRVSLQKEQLVFSSAHFITFAGDICECLHGHNYGLRGEIHGQLDENRYVIDFIAFRDALADIARQLDHHMLLPTKHPLILVEPTDQEVLVRFQAKRWIFPREDCCLLPIGNTTAEEIAGWIGQQLIERLVEKVKHSIDWLEISVDENHGQWGCCRIPWPTA